jgi:hypothetical protein
VGDRAKVLVLMQLFCRPNFFRIWHLSLRCGRIDLVAPYRRPINCYQIGRIKNGRLRAPNEDMMTWKLPAVQNPALLLAVGVAVAIGLAAPANAQAPDRNGRSSGPNVSYQQGPHTRIYVSRRSWLDGGTEVLPGDRKFTDYAFPQAQSFGRENWTRPIDRQPLNPPSDLGGYPQTFPLYPD